MAFKKIAASGMVAIWAMIASPLVAAEAERIAFKALVKDPKSYLEKPIRLPAIGCVDNPKGGFLCVDQIGGQMLRISADALGAKTSKKIAESLITDCKGTANLTSAECRVEIEISPRNAYRDTLETPHGSMPIVVIYSGIIDMFAPKGR